MRRICSQCGGEFQLGDEHVHIDQIRVWSASWTGRESYHNRVLRISKSPVAKTYVWFRDGLRDWFCRRVGGHFFDWHGRDCDFCGMSMERVEDRCRSLRAALKCYAVVL